MCTHQAGLLGFSSAALVWRIQLRNLTSRSGPDKHQDRACGLAHKSARTQANLCGRFYLCPELAPAYFWFVEESGLSEFAHLRISWFVS